MDMSFQGDLRVVFSTEWFSVKEIPPDRSQHKDSKPYYVITESDSIVVLPVTRDGQILLVRQFRPARNHITLEIPAGAIEAGETPAEAVVRELREETGYTTSEVEFLSCGALGLNRDTSNASFFVAFDVMPIPGAVLETGSEPVLMDGAAFSAMVRESGFEQIAALGVIALAKLIFKDRLHFLL
ncbi:MAG: NUDIX hydrolase [Alphaproteobacteria bacterium]|nr:NUDIX hydrolase [Alphaproteobacteria bacterium]